MSFHVRTAVLLGTTILAGAASMPGAAWAQTANAAGGSSIETVIVTAEKREENVKNVPMSITVIGEKDLQRLNAHSFEDYITTVPGMALIEESPTHSQLVLRGINAGGDGSTVGTLLDETPYGSSSALANAVDTAPNLDTFDIARVEVLRGPQGTLYGASTLGGLLKFVTNAPDPSGFAAMGELGGTTLDNGADGGDVHAMVNVPLDDDLAVRAVGYDQYNGGWIDDPGRKLKNINGVRSVGGRVSVLFKPDDKLTIRLSATMQDVDANNNNDEDVTVAGGKITPLYGTYQQQRTVNSFNASRYGVYSGVVNWDLDWATLTSDTSYGTYHDFQFADDTGALGASVQGFLRADKFTQEVRLASEPNSGPIDWLAGFYYTDETATLHQDIVFVPHGAALGSLILKSRYIETAGFVDATYHFTQDFDIGLGGRYSHNDQAANEFGLATAVGASQGDVFTWSADAHYRLDDATTLYARIAKGFRPGGPNTLPIGNPAGAPAFFGADSLIDYEAGVKTRSPGRRAFARCRRVLHRLERYPAAYGDRQHRCGHQWRFCQQHRRRMGCAMASARQPVPGIERCLHRRSPHRRHAGDRGRSQRQPAALVAEMERHGQRGLPFPERQRLDALCRRHPALYRRTQLGLPGRRQPGRVAELHRASTARGYRLAELGIGALRQEFDEREGLHRVLRDRCLGGVRQRRDGGADRPAVDWS